MNLTSIPRPTEQEHPAYVNYVLQSFTEPDALPSMEAQPGQLRQLLAHLPDEAGHYRYAPGKWILKQVLGHLLDQERVFADRLLRFSRGEAGPLPTFDHEAFAVNGGYEERTILDLLREFELLRGANLFMIRNLDAAALDRRGTVAGHSFTVRALAYLMAAHVQHHLRLIQERYVN